MSDDKKNGHPPVTRLRPIGHGHSHASPGEPWMPPPPNAEETERYERMQRTQERRHYIQQLTGSLVIASLKGGKQMTPADALKLANEIADTLSM